MAQLKVVNCPSQARPRAAPSGSCVAARAWC